MLAEVPCPDDVIPVSLGSCVGAGVAAAGKPGACEIPPVPDEPPCTKSLDGTIGAAGLKPAFALS